MFGHNFCITIFGCLTMMVTIPNFVFFSRLFSENEFWTFLGMSNFGWPPDFCFLLFDNSENIQLIFKEKRKQSIPDTIL